MTHLCKLLLHAEACNDKQKTNIEKLGGVVK